MNNTTNYRSARIGTYYNGHESQLIDQLNEVLQDVREDTIVHELFVNYFDDQTIYGIIEFFKDRFREHEENSELKRKHESIRNILIKNGSVEYGDCIIDEICDVVGMLPTTTYYSEEK